MSLRLLILGLLLEQPRHPYEIRQTIKERNWFHAFGLKDGSLYYAVDQMRDKALIAPDEVIPTPGDNRPDKIVYRITDRGRAEFEKLLYEQLDRHALPQHPMFSALVFAHRADKARLERHIAKQLAACEQRIASLEAVLELKGAWLPGGAVQVIRGMSRFAGAEREWLLELRAAAADGSLFAGKKAHLMPPGTGAGPSGSQ